MEQHINWNLVSTEIFEEFKGKDAETIAWAYVKEAQTNGDNNQSWDRLNAMFELGQGRFSVQNSREHRNQLFSLYISNAFKRWDEEQNGKAGA